MRYLNTELHNVAELLTGDGMEVLPPAAREWGAEHAGSLAPWQAEGKEGLWITRVPDAVRHALNPLAQMNALQATGSELRCVLDPGETLRVTLRSPFGPAIAEIYQGDFFVSWQVIGTGPTVVNLTRHPQAETLAGIGRAQGSTFDARMTRLLLPWRPPVRLLEIAGGGRPPEPGMAPARRYLAYGSSITHGNQCLHPSGSYTARVAHRLGADLINLGLGGGAHLEPELAGHIASRQDWDFATLEMGINIRHLGVAGFAPRVESFIRTIGSAHPGKPVFCLDVFTCDEDFSGQGNTAAYRRTVRRLVRGSGLSNLSYISGARLLRSPGGLTADLVHPSPQGMEEIAGNLAPILRRRMETL